MLEYHRVLLCAGERENAKVILDKLRSQLNDDDRVKADYWFSYSCSNGYYTANMEPVTLKETLEKYLVDVKDISAADRERIQKLADSIHENDNNYILYAKLK